MRDEALAESIRNSILATEIGQKVTIQFNGIPSIVHVEISFVGGWNVKQALAPGQSIELIRGEDGYLDCVNITIDPFDGLKEQICS